MATRLIRITSFEHLITYCGKNKRSMIHCAVRLDKHHFILLGHTWDPDGQYFLIQHYSLQIHGGMVVEESYSKHLLESDIENELYIFEDDHYPQTEAQFDVAYDRFEKRNGEKSFHILRNNYEHLVTYILAGRGYSRQTEAMSLTRRLAAVLLSPSQSGSCESPSVLTGRKSGCFQSSINGRNLPSRSSKWVPKTKSGYLLVILGLFFLLFSLLLLLQRYSVLTENLIIAVLFCIVIAILCTILHAYLWPRFRPIITIFSWMRYVFIWVWDFI